MPIKVYGADWCSMTTRTRDHLRTLGLQHEYVDIDKDDKAAEWVRNQNGGKEKKPTLDIGGTVLTEPSNTELDRVLRQQQII